MDPEIKKKVLRELTYGLYVVTAANGDDIAAGTVTWLSQASFAPPLVMIAVRVDSHLHAVVERSRAFAVNILAQGEQDIAAAFFAAGQPKDGCIHGYRFEAGPVVGAPLLVDLPAWFEARVTDTVVRGDHTVYVAEVVSAGMRNPQARPLSLRDTTWSYGG